MNQKIHHSSRDYISIAIDVSTILQDVKKYIWIIFTLSLSFSMFAYILDTMKYNPQYSASTTYLVTTHEVNNSMILSIEASSRRVSDYVGIIQSDVLKKAVANEVGIPEYELNIAVEAITMSNMFKVTVIQDSPEKAYRVAQSVFENTPKIGAYFFDGVTITEFKKTSIPTGTITPSTGKKSMAIVFILSFFGMTGLIAGLSCLKDTIRSGKDVERKLELPFLGACSFERKKTIKERLTKKNGTRADDVSVILQKDIGSQFLDSVDRMARRVQNAMSRKEVKVLLVTGTKEGEGTSAIAANIAADFSMHNRKVVLVDLDLKKPELYQLLQLTEDFTYGLAEYLNGTNDDMAGLIGTVPESGLHVVLNKTEIHQLTENTVVDRLAGLIDYLRQEYDTVILDTAPMSKSNDTEIMAGLADGVLMVVRKHNVSADKINDKLDILCRSQVELIGCVINGTLDSIFRYIGGPGYGKYWLKRFRPIRIRKNQQLET